MSSLLLVEGFDFRPSNQYILVKVIPGQWLLRLSKPQSLVRLNGLGKLKGKKKISNFVGSRTRDRPLCSIVPQPTTLPRAGWPLNCLCSHLIWTVCFLCSPCDPTNCVKISLLLVISALFHTAVAYLRSAFRHRRTPFICIIRKKQNMRTDVI
jgi:hypothetical protein